MAITSQIDPEQMTPRARTYLVTAALRHLIIGAVCVFSPGGFTSSSYQGVTDALGWFRPEVAIVVWGWLFIVSGIACALAAVTGREDAARIGLMLSVVTTACWGGGFLAAVVTGVSAGPTGAVIWIAVAIKDATMLRQPLRNPFEPIVQKVIAGQRERRNAGGV